MLEERGDAGEAKKTFTLFDHVMYDIVWSASSVLYMCLVREQSVSFVMVWVAILCTTMALYVHAFCKG